MLNVFSFGEVWKSYRWMLTIGFDGLHHWHNVNWVVQVRAGAFEFGFCVFRRIADGILKIRSHRVCSHWAEHIQEARNSTRQRSTTVLSKLITFSLSVKTTLVNGNHRNISIKLPGSWKWSPLVESLPHPELVRGREFLNPDELVRGRKILKLLLGELGKSEHFGYPGVRSARKIEGLL